MRRIAIGWLVSLLLMGVALQAQDDVAALEQRLWDVPVLYQMATDEVRAIAAAGAQLGNRADLFTTIGDSNTTNGDFLRPIGLERMPCRLGEYESLRETIAYFSSAPAGDSANAFVRESVSAGRGFGTSSVLDPFWAKPRVCTPGETPLACEYRLLRPAVAIILIGQIDINYGGGSVEQYRTNLEEIVTTSIGEGVIPVLTTLVYLPERDVYPTALAFNGVILDLAEQYGLPVINMWAAAQTLPNYGIGPDRSHLSAAVGEFCAFDGAERRYGGTLRNLLTLQALDTLRREVLQPAINQ